MAMLNNQMVYKDPHRYGSNQQTSDFLGGSSHFLGGDPIYIPRT